MIRRLSTSIISLPGKLYLVALGIHALLRRMDLMSDSLDKLTAAIAAQTNAINSLVAAYHAAAAGKEDTAALDALAAQVTTTTEAVNSVLASAQG